MHKYQEHQEPWIVTHITNWQIGIRSKNLIQVFTLENKDAHSRTWTQYKEFISQYLYYKDANESLHIVDDAQYCEDIKHKFIECEVGDTILGISLHGEVFMDASDTLPGGGIHYDKCKPIIDEAQLELIL